jgi:hypothetical protein
MNEIGMAMGQTLAPVPEMHGVDVLIQFVAIGLP